MPRSRAQAQAGEQGHALELLPPVSDAAGAEDVPGAPAGRRPALRCRGLALSPSGREWAAASTEGVLLYSRDSGAAAFDPTYLTEDLTPAAVAAALAAGSHARALLLALRLGEPGLVARAVLATPENAVPAAAAGVPPALLPALLSALAGLTERGAHLEFALGWVRATCNAHGRALREAALGGRVAVRSGTAAAPPLRPALRQLQKVLQGLHGSLASACDDNVYALQYLEAQAGCTDTSS